MENRWLTKSRHLKPMGETYESTMALLPKGGTEEVIEKLIEIIKKYN